MESKRKERKVRKASSAIPAQQKSDSQQPKPQSPEALIRHNGILVEQLFASEAWRDIAFPLLQESIAGVSGRFTNGRYWHGTLTTKWQGETLLFVSGYQKALMDFHNNLHDFIVAKNKQIEDRKKEEAEKKSPLVNPMMEDYELED